MICSARVLDSFSCSVDTPKGIITVSLTKADGTVTLTVNAVTAEGIVKLPDSFGAEVSVNGGTYEILSDGSIRLTEGTQYTITVK